MSRYNPARDITPAFVERVADGIAADGEVFVVLRWVGGHRDYALCRSRSELARLVAIVCDGTEVLAMRGRHLPIRGAVTEELIGRALEAVPDGSEYLIISAATAPAATSSRRSPGASLTANWRRACETGWGRRSRSASVRISGPPTTRA